MSEEKKTVSIPRTFMSAAYLKVLEKGLYGLYRNIEIEEFDRKKGYPMREKIKEIGPLRLLREARPGEEKMVVMKTYHSVEQRELSLVEER